MHFGLFCKVFYLICKLISISCIASTITENKNAQDKIKRDKTTSLGRAIIQGVSLILLHLDFGVLNPLKCIS